MRDTSASILALLLPSLTILGGCADDPTKIKNYEAEEIEDAGTPLDTGDPEATDDPVDERVFALLEVVSTLIDDPNPFSGETGTTQLFATKRVEWRREGVQVQWRERVCGMSSTEIFGTLTVYPELLVSSLPEVERQATLSDAVVGATFVMEAQVTLLGAILEDPYLDPMPDTAEDPEVWDQDGDSLPGVTVRVDQELLGSGEVYVAQRTFTSYEGVVESATRVGGYLESDNEQVVLDASTWWLLLETNSRDDPERDHSWFAFEQIESSMSCEDIQDQAGELFGI